MLCGMKDKGLKRTLDHLGKEIKILRTSAGLSQEALALEAGVDRTYVSQLERGVANPSLKILFRISKVLKAEFQVTYLGNSLKSTHKTTSA